MTTVFELLLVVLTLSFARLLYLGCLISLDDDLGFI